MARNSIELYLIGNKLGAEHNVDRSTKVFSQIDKAHLSIHDTPGDAVKLSNDPYLECTDSIVVTRSYVDLQPICSSGWEENDLVHANFKFFMFIYVQVALSRVSTL